MKNKKPRIAFIGPIAELNKPAKGGYESANRRTITLLRKHNIEVLELTYPHAQGGKLHKTLTYMLRFLNIAILLILHKNNWDIMHITPLRRQFIKPERLLCKLGKIMGKKILLDIRAGTLISHYNTLGSSYAKQIDLMIGQANMVCVEGEDYIDFVRARTSKDVVYFPNYMLWNDGFDNIEKKSPQESNQGNFVCLGRLIPEKGLEIAIEIIDQLNKRGITARLTIIGTGDSEYVKSLHHAAENLPVEFTGSLAPDEIIKTLSNMHFFLFPTTHKGEGHSNALTEAMAMACVPICSDNGFNKTVVGDTGISLLKMASSQDYVAAILPIINDNERWKELSTATNKRVKENFSDKSIIDLLLEKYNSLM